MTTSELGFTYQVLAKSGVPENKIVLKGIKRVRNKRKKEREPDGFVSCLMIIMLYLLNLGPFLHRAGGW